MKMSLASVLFLASLLLSISNPCAFAHTGVSPEQARDLIDSADDLVVVDVREPSEYCDARGHIPGAVNYPWTSDVLQSRYGELPMDNPILVVCRSGRRSNLAAEFLESLGFSAVYDMLGGMNAWLWETVPCKYAGGSGTADDPYRIATAADLIALGETPEDYDKHVILTADLDLDPNLPGRKVFDTAVIAPDLEDASPFQGTPFTGTLDGNGHVISGLRLIADADCDNYLGLFGELHGTVRDLGLSNAVVQGQPGGYFLGVMAGVCDGTIERCYAGGAILGNSFVGGLVGSTGGDALMVDCYAQVEVGVFEGQSHAGGLVANNGGAIRTSYATGAVGGVPAGLSPGGLVSISYGPIILSFWDTESSGVSVSYGGFGRTTAEMTTAATFAGWSGDVWELTEGDYPRLAWEKTGGAPLANEVDRTYAGAGTEEDPFLLADANDLYALACRPDDWHGTVELIEDINMVSIARYPTIADFRGVLNGNGHVVRHLRIHENTSMLGLVGFMRPGAVIQGLTLENVSIAGYSRLGGLVAVAEGGRVTNCAVEGTLDGAFKLGGLGGHLELVSIVGCSANVRIFAGDSPEIIGGLIGYARGRSGDSEYLIRDCYAVATFTLGDRAMACGGLAGATSGVAMSNCYAVSQFSLGQDYKSIGGLVGDESSSTIETSYWDKDVSGLRQSAGGTPLSTAQMQISGIFLDTGWDFVCEVANGTEDIWYMPEGDYPRLAWELAEVPACPATVVELNARNFGGTIANGVVLVDFHATWCSHCWTQAPILDEVAEQVQGEAQVAKLDIDAVPSVAQTYGVTAIPTLIVFKNGEVFQRFLGVTQAPVLIAAIQAAIDD